MRLRAIRRRGFTLVEIIVVLVVLAILAAIAVPAMIGWIDKAKQKRLIVECRTCVSAAQTLVAEDYGETGQKRVPEVGRVALLAGMADRGSVSGMSLGTGSAQIAHLTFTEAQSGDRVTYCSDATCGDYYIFNESGGGLQTPGDGTPVQVFAGAGSVTGRTNSIDSGAPLVRPNGNATFNGLINSLIGHLAEFNIASWAVREQGKKLYWTDTDISGLAPGTQVRVIFYDAQTSQYTAGYVAVDNKRDPSVSATPYHTLDTSQPIGDATPTTGDYAAVVDAFNLLPATR